MRQFIVPPYLLAHLATAAQERLPRVARAARNALRDDEPVRIGRAAEPRHDDFGAATPTAMHRKPTGPQRTIYDAQGAEELPGNRVRTEGEPDVEDVAVNEAYAGLGATYALFADVYGRASINDRGLPLDATVHYGRDYDNAFWDGSRMVFGDGDGEIFTRFTRSLSVLGHELAHGLTQYTTNLVYQGQSGALNESVSDVFGVLVEQREKNEDAAAATWLVGAGLFTDAVHGVALRSMKAPGTAYDDDLLGRDPQPADMGRYVETNEDYGGCTSTPASRIVRSASPRRPSAVTHGRALAGSGMTPSPTVACPARAASSPSQRPPWRPPRQDSGRARGNGTPSRKHGTRSVSRWRHESGRLAHGRNRWRHPPLGRRGVRRPRPLRVAPADRRVPVG